MSEMNYNPAEVGGAAEKPKGGKKKGLIITIAAVAVVAVVASVAAGILLSSPMTLVARGAANSAKAIQKADMVKLLTDMAAGGSMELALGLEELAEQAFGVALDGSVNMKFYSSEDARGATTVGLELGGETFADISLFASKEELILASDVLLDDEAYGINFENAADNFEDSIFGPDGYLSIGVENIDMFLDLIEMNEEMTAKQAEVIAEVMEVLLDSMKEHGEISKESDTLKFGGESTKVTAVEIVLDDDAIADVICDVLDHLRDSEKFEEYIELYAEYAASAQKITAIADYMDSQSYYEYYYDIYSFDEYYDYFYGDVEMDIDEIYDGLDEIEDSLDDLEIDEIALVCYISKSGTQLIGFELEIESYGETMQCALVAGPRLDKLTELRFSVDYGYDTVEITYEVETNDKSEYVATLSVEEYGEEILSGEIEWDKKGGDFELFLEDDGGDMLIVSGELAADSKSAVFQLNEISSYGDSVELDLTLTLNASDKMPSAPDEYDDILELTDDDIEELAADVAARLMEAYYDLDSEVLEVLQMLMYSLW